MVVKIDKSEAFRPVRGILFGVSTVVFLLIILLGVGIISIIRYQRYSYYKEIAKNARALQESEEKVRKLNETLEQKVKNRTIQLEQANKELESFSYSVSHDLRAPLRHILGFAEFLKNEISAVGLKPSVNLDRIMDSAEEMGHLIDTLLEYSRNSQIRIKHTKTDMNSLVHIVINETMKDTSGRKISWNVGNLPELSCDVNLMKRVLVNLIENAVKYTCKKNETEITIGSTEKPDEFVFFIKDNGVGFDMEFSEKLFGVFQRLHLKKDFPGTGIGLANVRRIISMHGGKVWAESEINKGATFFFTLPKNPEEANETS